MNWDELEPKKPAAGAQLGEPLETLSIAELEARLTALEAELGRVRAERDKKKAHEAAADALFKR
jgi:uncharacterized small protein (DUF1192 family)